MGNIVAQNQKLLDIISFFMIIIDIFKSAFDSIAKLCLEVIYENIQLHYLYPALIYPVVRQQATAVLEQHVYYMLEWRHCIGIHTVIVQPAMEVISSL